MQIRQTTRLAKAVSCDEHCEIREGSLTALISVADLGYTVEAVFLVMLDGLSSGPLPQLGLVLFFSLLFTVGLATLLFQLDLVISAIQDNFWGVLNKYLKSREVLAGQSRSSYIHPITVISTAVNKPSRSCTVPREGPSRAVSFLKVSSSI